MEHMPARFGIIKRIVRLQVMQAKQLTRGLE
jgi:hypothetical protein